MARGNINPITLEVQDQYSPLKVCNSFRGASGWTYPCFTLCHPQKNECVSPPKHMFWLCVTILWWGCSLTHMTIFPPFDFLLVSSTVRAWLIELDVVGMNIRPSIALKKVYVFFLNFIKNNNMHFLVHAFLHLFPPPPPPPFPLTSYQCTFQAF